MNGSGTPAHPERLRALTSFRFIACAMIVGTHSSAYFDVPTVRDVLQLTQGVSFFFVLSGFILAYNYDRPGGTSWQGFYAARIARIWPAHLAALALFFFAATDPFGAASDFGRRVATLAANATLVHSWLPLRGFFFSYNAVSWSLSTELGFYLLFPLLVRRRPGTLPWAALVAGFALAAFFVGVGAAFRLTLHGEPFGPSLLGVILVNPLARLFEFCLGIFACALFRRFGRIGRPSSTWLEVGVLIPVLACLYACTEARVRWLPDALGYYLVWSGSAIAFAAMILVYAAGDGPLARLMSIRPFVFLGEISFCLYLIHLPVLIWITEHRALPPAGPAGITLYWLVCLVIASSMFLWIERPARLWLLRRLRPPAPAALERR